MIPADDFSDEYGWDDESLQRRQRRRKSKSKDRLDLHERDNEAEKPKKGFERRSRREHDWDDEYSEEY
ncbi:MAG TPA: hypothetical protein PKY01_04635 [Candidatus Hydrogenedentes bacterium]|nr:hypothetical protein [Candidatus Hydrogenedentota bacterium]HQH51686.1 hypothetical protein [Candidatus Hydrogenedentota bacterium]HQM50479.1 hypothetical protein [Candidatus Hydrogenedentota bacterium]